jgi:hypothetical protein
VWTLMPPNTCYLKQSGAGKRVFKGYISGCVTNSSGACKAVPPAPPTPSPHGKGSFRCDVDGGERGVCIKDSDHGK